MAAAGDVNGDGFADLLVGATTRSAAGGGGGAAYVVYGGSGITGVNLDHVALGIGGFRIIGETNFDFAGYAVSAAGDVNRDGRADLLVGRAIDRDLSDNNVIEAAYVIDGQPDW